MCMILMTTLFAMSTSADIKQAGYTCHPAGTSFSYWYVYHSRMTNNSTSTRYLDCPIAGVDLQNYLYGYAYVIDHSTDPVYCTLGATNNDGYYQSGYYATRNSTGDYASVQTLDFGSGGGVNVLGRTPVLHCQVPPKDSSGNQSGMANYVTYSLF